MSPARSDSTQSLRRSLLSGKRAFLVKTWVLLSIVRVGLVILRYPRMQRLLERLGRPRMEQSDLSVRASELNAIGRAVTGASRFVPGARCLAQALVAHVLLRRRGIPADIRIGAAKDEAGDLKAHAWVDVEGVTVVGGGDLERYTVLTPPAVTPPAVTPPAVTPPDGQHR